MKVHFIAELTWLSEGGRKRYNRHLLVIWADMQKSNEIREKRESKCG